MRADIGLWRQGRAAPGSDDMRCPSGWGEMGSDHDFRLHSSYGRGLARDQAFVAKRRLIAGEPARAALSEAFR